MIKKENKKELEQQFVESLKKYLNNDDEDALEDAMFAANLLVAKRYYKPMSCRDLYKEITGENI